MVFESTADARLAFGQLRNYLEQLETYRDFIVHTWISSWFNSRYGQRTSDGLYSRIIRIRDTMFYVNTIEENAADVARVLQMLGQ